MEKNVDPNDLLNNYKEIKCIYKVDGRAAYLCESLKDNSLVILKKI